MHAYMQHICTYRRIYALTTAYVRIYAILINFEFTGTARDATESFSNLFDLFFNSFQLGRFDFCVTGFLKRSSRFFLDFSELLQFFFRHGQTPAV